MGYYLPIHDIGSTQYTHRVNKRKIHPLPIVAPEKIVASKKKSRDDFDKQNEYESIYPHIMGEKRKIKQNFIFDLTGKGKYIDESI